MDGEPPRREAKGKGKEIGPSRGGTPEHKDAGPSLPRIAQSAASLPSILLSGLPTAALGGGNEKGESSRAGEALARAEHSSVRLRSNIPTDAGLRSGNTEEHVAQEEASFAAFLDSRGAPMLSEPSELDGAWQSAITVPGPLRATSLTGPPLHSVAEQESKDGADVVALLSGDDDLEQVFDHVGETTGHGDLSCLRKALFGDGSDGSTPSIAWDDVLNFIPEYLQANTAPGVSPGVDLPMHLGTPDAGEAWHVWIGQWSRVLTSYQDEVWGDLSALVEEARTEVRRIEKAKPGEQPPEPKALLRLRGILGHLRGV